MKEEYLRYLIDVRYNWINDLPSYKVNTLNERYLEYKCRGNCFVGVSSRISRLIRKGIIVDCEVIEKGNIFIDYVKKRDFLEFSTKEDLEKLDQILDLMIEYLRK
ncbi:hypothetical protein ACFL08_01650 [Patescibacteria group bacterium]